MKTPEKNEFETLCRIMATEEEILSYYMISKTELNKFCRETYDKSFQKIYEDLRNQGKLIIRQQIFKSAQQNPAIALKLGEEFLGLGENKDSRNKAEENKKVKTFTPLEIVKLNRKKDA